MLRLHRRHHSEPASEPTPERESDAAAWAELPALSPAGGDVELTAPTQSFLRSLQGRREPPLSLAPLGHDVRLGAPAGIATGIARTVQASTATRPSLDLRPRPRPRPLQRLLRRAAAIVAPPDADVSPSALEAPDHEPAAPVEAAGGPEPEPQAAEAAETGAPGEARPVAPVAAGLVSAPERAEAPAAPQLPVAARSPAAPAAHAPAPAPSLPDLPTRVLRAADPPAEPERPLLVAPAELPAATPAAPVLRELADEAPPAEPPARAEAEPSSPPPLRPKRIVRRLGLGPPLPSGAAAGSGPPSAAVQRSAAVEAPAAEPAKPSADFGAKATEEQQPATPVPVAETPVAVRRSATPEAVAQEAPSPEVDARRAAPVVFRSVLDVAPSAPPAEAEPHEETGGLEASFADGLAPSIPPQAEAGPQEEGGRDAPLVGGFPAARPVDAAGDVDVELDARARTGAEETAAPPASPARAEPAPPVVARSLTAGAPRREPAPSVVARSTTAGVPRPEPAPLVTWSTAPGAPGPELALPVVASSAMTETLEPQSPIAESLEAQPSVSAATPDPRPEVGTAPAPLVPVTAAAGTARAPRTAPLVAARSIAQLQRSAFASTEPAVGSDAPATLSRTIEAAAAGPPPRRLEAASAAEAGAPFIRRAATPFPPAGHFGPELPPALGPVPPVVARHAAPIATPVPVVPVTVAREAAAPEPSAAAAPLVEAQPGPGEPLQPAEAAAPAPAADAPSPQSVEEMAARLYDRIRSRLRDELLVDRERAGLVTDVR